ncbi:MAG: hypothetical protein HY319_11520 [Armatimonadetes bacterium]|nr:hypothetical protein [Armatimonadota bacterium]
MKVRSPRTRELQAQLRARATPEDLVEPLDTFQPEGSWTETRKASWGWRRAWSDSPNRNYENHQDCSLVARLPLGDLAEPRLVFWESHWLENGYDRVQLEISQDGSHWKELDSFSGFCPRARRSIDLADYAGKNVRVRFHLTTDGSKTRPGITLGKLKLEGRDRYTGLARSFSLEDRNQETAERLVGFVEDGGDLARLSSLNRELGNLDSALRLTAVSSPELVEFARHEGPSAALAAVEVLAADPRRTLDHVRAARKLSLDGQWEERCDGLVAAGLSAEDLRHLEELAGTLGRWRAEGDWAQVRKLAWGGARVWTDSPGGSYKNHEDSSVYTPPVSLRGLSDVELSFWESHHLEKGYDHVQVEASEDGKNWTSVLDMTGLSLRSHRTVDLSAYDGKVLRLRFRLTSDGSKTHSGLSFGSLKLKAKGPDGQPVELTVQESGQEVLDRLLRAAVGAGDLAALSRTASALGSLEAALELWEAFPPNVHDPDFETRRQALVRLAQQAGVDPAVKAWPELASLDPERLERAVRAVETSGKELGIGEALRLWPGLAPHLDDADFEQRRAALTTLAAREGVEQARRIEVHADMPLSLEQQVELRQRARELEPEGAEETCSRLVAAGVDETGIRALKRLLAEDAKWQPEGTWAQVRKPLWGFDRVWTDSPWGRYRDHENSSVTSPPISLVGVTGARLDLALSHSLEKNCDHVLLEASVDDRTWEQLQSYTGLSLRKHEQVDLSRFDGRQVKLRFRLQSDGSLTRTGFTFATPDVTGRNALTGEPLRFPVEEPDRGPTRRALLEMATDPRRSPAERNQDLARLADLAEKLHSVELALAIRSLDPGDVSRQKDLVSLVSGAGADIARQVWPSVVGHETALQHIHTMKEELSSFSQAASLWPLLAPDADRADLSARRDALTLLARREGVQAARELWPSLRGESSNTWTELVELRTRARELQTGARDVTFRKLAAAGLDAAACQALKTLLREPRDWSPEGTWAETRSPLRAFAKVWSDSPWGRYRNHEDSSLTTPVVSLLGLEKPSLSFRESHSLERDCDFVSLEASEDGSRWKQLARYTGRQLTAHPKLDLAEYEGKNVRFRFRLTSDGSRTKSGLSFGKLTISGMRDGRPEELVVGEQDSQAARERLLELATDAGRPADIRSRTLVALGRLAEAAGGLEPALALLPALDPHLDAPDFEARVDSLARLSKLGGADRALRAWPDLKGSSSLAELESLAGRIGPDNALRAWELLRPLAEDQDYADKRDTLAERIQKRGADAALDDFGLLMEPSRGSMAERADVLDLAEELAKRIPTLDREQLLAALLSARLTRPARAGMRRLLSEEADTRWSLGRKPPLWWGEVWSDSPYGRYKDNEDSALTFAPISLVGARGARLEFSEGHSLEKDVDHVRLEASENGRQWTLVRTFSGRSLRHSESVDLSAYDGKNVQLRFRLTSDGSKTGWGYTMTPPRLRARRGGEEISVPLDAGECIDWKKVLEAALAPSESPKQRSWNLEYLAGLGPPRMAALFGFVDRYESRGITLSEALESVMAASLTPLEGTDPLQAGLQALLYARGLAPRIVEEEDHVNVGGVQVNKRKSP